MEDDATYQKALNATYRLLTYRPHSKKELETKLAKKGFPSSVVTKVLEKITTLGYMNDEEVAMRWACSLIEQRRWGKGKVTQYLWSKGIPGEIISRVEKAIWKKFDEETIARNALEKHFRGLSTNPAREKKARFLASRGFSTEVIYRIVG